MTEESIPTSHPVHQRTTRTRGRRARLAIVAVALLGIGGGTGVAFENAQWAPRYERTAHNLVVAQKDASDFQRLATNGQFELDMLNKRIADTVGDLDHPNFVLWNSCSAAGPDAGCPLRPGYEYVGGIPDTFTYYVHFHSTVPVTVEILSTQNFVCWETHACVWRGVGWDHQMQVNGVFHDAEGCAGYIVVFVSDHAGTLYPNVTVSRNPAAYPTGVCA